MSAAGAERSAVVTRDDVLRECERRGWWLCTIGDRHFVIAERGNGETIGEAASAEAAFLDACRNEGITPY